MQQFQGITIGTSGAGGELPLAEGLPLFPKLGAARAGTSASSQYHELYDVGSTVLFWRFKSSAYYEFFMGLVGPAVAFRFGADVTLSNVGSGGAVTVSNLKDQEMIAGLEAGLAVGGGISIKQDLYLPSSWYSPWKFTWKTVLDLTVGFEINLLALFFELVSYLLTQGAADGLWKKSTTNPFAKLSNRLSEAEVLLGSSNNEIGPNDHSLRATAGFTFPVDLVDAVPVLGKFVKLLEKIKADLSCGPSIGLGIPVDLSLQKFRVEGGLADGNKTADYDSLSYTDTGVVATGPVPFSNTANATKLTTFVSYTSSFTILLSFSINISVCKLFSLGVAVPSLDLLNLLGLPRPSLPAVPGDVSTDLTKPPYCVLIPLMTISFSPPTGQDDIRAGVVFLGTVSLDDTWQDPSTNVALTIDPPAPDFPSSVPLEKGASVAQFLYTFPNRCLPSGDPEDPTSTLAPTPIAPYSTYSVKASIPSASSGCRVYEVTGALKVLNNVIIVKLLQGVAGDAPDWNEGAGAQLNGDPTQAPLDVPNYVVCEYVFNYPNGQAPGSATVKLALYDDQRRPHVTSTVRISFSSGASATISAANPTPAVSVPIPPNTAPGSFRVEWLSPGSHVNYSTRFYLTMDAGCAYGRTEFWLNVWNWS